MPLTHSFRWLIKSLLPVRNQVGEGFFSTDIDPDRIPAHIAFIMDGNGRWAEKRGLPRTAGHKAGTEAIRRVLLEAGELGVKYLTFYAFSLENWTRPDDEVSALMRLFIESLHKEIDELDRSGVVIKVCGRIDDLPKPISDAFKAAVERTRNNSGLTMILALNYGGRAEIIDAAKKAAAAGKLEELDESGFHDYLYLPEVPDPDMIVRTSGEVRLSNFLLWQSAYAEMYFSEFYWPDFDKQELRKAIVEYQRRGRRFGGL